MEANDDTPVSGVTTVEIYSIPTAWTVVLLGVAGGFMIAVAVMLGGSSNYLAALAFLALGGISIAMSLEKTHDITLVMPFKSQAEADRFLQEHDALPPDGED